VLEKVCIYEGTLEPGLSKLELRFVPGLTLHIVREPLLNPVDRNAVTITYRTDCRRSAD